MENNQFLNKIYVRLKLNNQFEQVLMWFIGIAIYLIAFSIFIGKAPLLDAVYQTKIWLGEDFFLYVGVGLLAQLVDGSLGMAYGITSTSFLLGIGVPPALSSTSVHVSEMFTTGASAISHYQFKNINKKLFSALLWGAENGSFEYDGKITPVSPLKKLDKNWGFEVTYFKDKAEFRTKVRIVEHALDIFGGIKGQLCNDKKGICIPFEQKFQF
ncbi:sulfite exporter TauE/SafE family protein [Arcicella rosea]|uniref:Probable membrane transporter protein n=1 Tax=Arcicella rosea TaxID=502909 RepID=A0A841EPQ9_9BACT|nr:sulfite exporter TauE/SafE family protein [Arcicella rosea]MBB6002708.1 hypothetical protein [Arcicella rosea]